MFYVADFFDFGCFLSVFFVIYIDILIILFYNLRRKVTASMFRVGGMDSESH